TVRTGVFIDVVSRETGLSTTLNSQLTLFDTSGTNVVASNDNGYDFDTGYPAPFKLASATTADSALYADLNPGISFVRVSPARNTTGSYEFPLRFDPDHSNNVPVLNSNPGATDPLLPNFRGYTGTNDPRVPNGSYTIPPFDING